MGSARRVPDIVLIGHATRDLIPSGWLLGGTVAYAGVTAERLGMRAGILTSGPDDVVTALGEMVPDSEIVAIPSATALTFENIYEGGARRQFIRGQAAPLTLEDLPEGWDAARLVLLAPLAQEVDPRLARAFPQAFIGATPQGWLRQWDTQGLVRPGIFELAGRILPHLSALILSREDVMARPHVISEPGVPRTIAEADALIAGWARTVPLVAVTLGPAGALLYRNGAAPERFPGYPAQEVDPTGAGDVFAAAFLSHLRECEDAGDAVDFANRCAACSVERTGITGIPTREEMLARFGG